MNFAKLAGILAAFAVTAAAQPSWAAATWFADCSTGGATSGQILRNGVMVTSGLLPTNTLGFSLLGTPTGPGQLTPGPVAGDVIEINSICTEDVTVTTSGLTIVNDSNSGSLNTSDGVQGQLEISGASSTVLDGILLTAPASFGGSEVANLFIHDGAAAAVKNTQISNGPLIGVLATRSAEIDLEDTTVSSNGGGTAATSSTNMGVLASSNATLYLGRTDGTAPPTIASNSGAGVVISDASSVVIYGATINSNGLQQVELLSASSGLITGLGTGTTQITAPSHGCCQAIFASGASTLDVEQGAVVTGNQTNAAIALNASTLLLQSSVVTSGVGAATPSKSEATIHGTGNSVIALAGGNVICFGTPGVGVPCSITDGGLAVAVDHVSTLVQVSGNVLGYQPAVDNLGGGAQVILQSTVDLGRGLLTSTPTLSWVTGSANIAVAQNSSFRLQGGVNITGKLSLGQASNGFFNKIAGGTNTVSTGIACNFTTVPAAHVVGNAAVSPSPTLASSMSAATTGQCLPF